MVSDCLSCSFWTSLCDCCVEGSSSSFGSATDAEAAVGLGSGVVKFAQRGAIEWCGTAVIVAVSGKVSAGAGSTVGVGGVRGASVMCFVS